MTFSGTQRRLWGRLAILAVAAHPARPPLNEPIKILRAVHGSAQADGSADIGRISFRLSGSPERRWMELFDASKGTGFTTEERNNEFVLHIQCQPGEVSAKRDAALALVAEVNERRRGEIAQQNTASRERHERKRSVEDALNRELEALKFE